MTMQPWTRDQLHRFAPPPRARFERDERPENHAAYVGVFLESWDFLQRNGVNTPLRLAHFMTIVGHETGGLQIVREECTWRYERMCQLWPDRFKLTDPIMRARYVACRGDEEKLAELAYGGWCDLGKRLGNTEPGDGWLYRGNGPFQDTGRSRHREAGSAIGIDLEGSPEQLEDPRVAIKAVLWAWNKFGLGEMADRNYLRAIQNCINRGNPFSKKDPNGWPDRQRWFDRAWAVWGDGILPSPLELSVGAQGAEVLALQMRLRELGYAVGAPDTVFGPETRRAIAAFKSDYSAMNPDTALEPADLVGPVTRSALATADPIRRPERERMTVADLKAAGSTEVAAGQNIQRLGPMMLGLGAIGGASQGTPERQAVDPTPMLQDTVGWVPTAKATIEPVIHAGQWAVSHWWWVALICLGVWMYAKGGRIIKARLEAARRGLNLWR
jgi:putative chitinase